MQTISKSFKLNASACDEIAELITEFCNKVGTERKDTLRYRISAEECLLYWIEHGLQDSTVSLQLGKYLLYPFVTLEIEGPSLNPYREESENYGEYTGSVIVSLGLSPEYSYSNGVNRIRFRIKKKSLGQIAILCLVLAAAALIGILGTMIIPAGIRGSVLETVIDPLYDTFFRILGCIAGPMIFMSVAWGVYGIGDVATFGKIGRRMMRSFMLVTLISSASGVLFFPLLGPALTSSSGSGGQLGSITEMLLGIFPSNIVEPFETGNTLQIIFMSIIIGIALLYLGRQTSSIARAIDQLNILVQFLMQLISKLVPYVIFLVVLSMIWSGGLSVFLSTWKFFAILLSAMILLSAAFVLITSVHMKADPVMLIRKNIPTFLIALTTASSAAAFGSNVETCEKEFGIEPSLIRFGIPLGMVMHKPVSAIYNLLLAFYFARQYDVTCSIGWICTAVFICAILAIATPPIPGGGAIAYSVIFLQLGIPAEAMAIALALDVITDFFITSFEMFELPLSLINTASRMGMIDTEILRH